jgi:hypothetical protein
MPEPTVIVRMEESNAGVVVFDDDLYACSPKGKLWLLKAMLAAHRGNP